MQNKLIKISMLVSLVFAIPAVAATGAASYNPDGSMFQKIADLEQEKVLLQLEKEKAQLQLDMDRLAAEQARIKNEMEEMSGAGDTKAEALELERQRLEMEKQKLDAQRKNMDNSAGVAVRNVPAPVKEQSPIQEKYRLIEIIGAGRQLFATIEDEKTGQRKKISVGKELDGYRVDSVSLDDGVMLSKDGETATLGIHPGE